jgi:hypothetical protein
MEIAGSGQDLVGWRSYPRVLTDLALTDRKNFVAHVPAQNNNIG